MKEKIKSLLYESIEKLKIERPIFHSEADFQHELAVKIKEENRNVKIRLEKNVASGNKKKNYVDLIIEFENYEVFIELKYTTIKTEINFLGENFRLTNQLGEDAIKRHFFLDIHDLERIKCSEGKIKLAFAIFLTNDKKYWREERDVLFKEFYLFDGKKISPGNYRVRPTEKISNLEEINARWRDLGGKKNFGNVEILGNYGPLKWRNYSNKAGEFKFLVVEIKC